MWHSRRIPDYAIQFADFNAIASIGAFGFGLSQLLFLYILLKTLKQDVTAEDKVWEGAEGLEWTLPSPPPYHSFEKPPRVEWIKIWKKHIIYLQFLQCLCFLFHTC